MGAGYKPAPEKIIMKGKRTISEQVFEEFCTRRGIECQHVPEGDTQTPDYEIVLGAVRIVVEVKEITPNKKEQESDRLLLKRGYGTRYPIRLVSEFEKRSLIARLRSRREQREYIQAFSLYSMGDELPVT